MRVLGPVEVVSNDGGASSHCERSKAVELIVWLSQHRERPTRTAARTALWDLDVRDATFANVVSDARRAMARARRARRGRGVDRAHADRGPAAAPAGRHRRRVVGDRASRTHAASRHSMRSRCCGRAWSCSCGMPFAGTSYLWTDAEGITSSLIAAGHRRRDRAGQPLPGARRRRGRVLGDRSRAEGAQRARGADRAAHARPRSPRRPGRRARRVGELRARALAAGPVGRRRAGSRSWSHCGRELLGASAEWPNRRDRQGSGSSSFRVVSRVSAS